MLNQKNKLFGLWSGKPIVCNQNIYNYIDLNAKVDTRVLYYLRYGRYYDTDNDYDYVPNTLSISLGLCTSIFDKEDSVGPSCIITDGVWIWNTVLAFYVEFHHVKIPDDFLQHIRNNNYEIPELTEEQNHQIYQKYQYMVVNNITEL